MALLWLTVGFPVTNNHYLADRAQHITMKDLNDHGNTEIPFEKASEENAELSSGDVISEYLKTDAEPLAQINITINYNRFFTTCTFVNFCSELVSPPPENFVC
jgi:hypothetical protein